jgi:hypothetical protein
MPRYYGKHRGKVVQNLDPLSRGRVLVNVPTVMGTGNNWALPAVPFTGVQAGFYVVPPVQANVWVEFEEGDEDKPIWCGGFWDAGTVPQAALTPPAPVAHILLQTTGQNFIHVCDGPAAPLTAGGIVLRSGASTIVIGPDGVKIIAPRIELKGMTIVNDGALTVTP